MVQLRQIYMDYHLGVSFRDITVDEIRFFYEPLIDGLLKIQNNQNGKENGQQIRS